MAPPRKKRKRRPSQTARRAARTDVVVADEVEAKPEPAGKISVKDGVLTVSGGDWSHRDLLVLSACAGVIFILLVGALAIGNGVTSPLDILRAAAVYASAAYALAIVFIFLSVWIAMPLAARFTGRRRLKFFEVLAYTAVIAFLCALTTSGVIALLPKISSSALMPAPSAPATPLPEVTPTPSARATASATASATAHVTPSATAHATASATAHAAPSASPYPSASAQPSPSAQASSGGGTGSTPAQVPSDETISAIGVADLISFAAAPWLFPPIMRVLRGRPREPAGKGKAKPKGGRSR